ncbi:formate/nitrite transporter family protein [Flavobacteriaceae bacterium TP-CH-4]|uniref:Formate/nitrite transporter family protein n=1 Tax=Pelagihabitans pacificus TaxID=2696054 RepID=A0A967ECA0_9FLAO|nr:formate/nitrite transporter family protein [Pelagihabitans pacificus]NHF61021.1 formate/nitrite transporter family protein [Pelagihabitans pacificus]
MTDKKDKIEKAVTEIASEQQDHKGHEAVLVEQLCEGLARFKDQKLGTFLSSLSAGLEIGFSFMLVAIFHTFFSASYDSETVFFICAFAYPIGFILVVMGKSVLFTEQTSLLSLPVLHGKYGIQELLALWGVVIVGNLLGGFLISLFLLWIGPALGIISTSSIIAVAKHVAHYDLLTIFGSAVLAGWLMGLLSWSVSSVKSSSSQIILIYLITLVIGLAGLHHSIVGSIEVFSGVLLTGDLQWSDYAGFEITALTGNLIGGVVFVALLKYGAFAANV